LCTRARNGLYQAIRFAGVHFRVMMGQAALGQIRSVHKTRLVKLGDSSETTADDIAGVLVEMFQHN
jgi:hypothetical protein